MEYGCDSFAMISVFILSFSDMKTFVLGFIITIVRLKLTKKSRMLMEKSSWQRRAAYWRVAASAHAGHEYDEESLL